MVQAALVGLKTPFTHASTTRYGQDDPAALDNSTNSTWQNGFQVVAEWGGVTKDKQQLVMNFHPSLKHVIALRIEVTSEIYPPDTFNLES